MLAVRTVVDGEGFEPSKRGARQIYSLLPLTDSGTHPCVLREDLGAIGELAMGLEPAAA